MCHSFSIHVCFSLILELQVLDIQPSVYRRVEREVLSFLLFEMAGKGVDAARALLAPEPNSFHNAMPSTLRLIPPRNRFERRTWYQGDHCPVVALITRTKMWKNMLAPENLLRKCHNARQMPSPPLLTQSHSSRAFMGRNVHRNSTTSIHTHKHDHYINKPTCMLDQCTIAPKLRD